MMKTENSSCANPALAQQANARSLRRYQQAAIDKFKGKSAFFAMEMRLGKTLAAIRWIETQEVRRVLILAPKTVLTAWEEELEHEGLDFLNLVTLKGGVERRAAFLENPPNKYLLLNYETLPRLSITPRFDCIVADESTRLKNPKAKVTHTALAWAKRAEFLVGLSGQPCPENWLEMWTQLAFVSGGSWMGFNNFWKWRKAYFNQFGFDWVPKKSKISTIKEAFHESAFVMTRKMAGLSNEKIYQKLTSDLTQEERELYKTIGKTWALPNGEKTKYAMVVAGWYRRLTSGVLLPGMSSWKYGEVIRLLEEDLSGQQVIVWCSFRNELYQMWKMLKEKSFAATWMSGDTDYKDRQKRIALFRTGKRSVFLIQVQCGQFGIDLSNSDTAIYLSSPWSYEHRCQSEDRIFKVGKTSSLLIIDLITKNTIDEIVQESLRCKNSSAKFLLDRANIKPPKGFMG